MTNEELIRFWLKHKDFEEEPKWMKATVDRIADAVGKKAAWIWKHKDEFDIFCDIYRTVKLDLLDAITLAVPWLDIRIAQEYAEHQTQILCLKYYESRGGKK